MSVTTRRKKRKSRHEEIMAALRNGEYPDLTSKEQSKLMNTIDHKPIGRRKALGPQSAWALRDLVNKGDA